MTNALAAAQAAVAAARVKLARLAAVEPYFIDLSLRENVFGSNIGQTLQDKLQILPKLRQFGFQNILLGTLDYALETEREVDDDFMEYLRDNHIDMTGGFAFTDVGLVDQSGGFTPSLSMQKLASYGVPNTLHEIYLSPQGIATQKYTLEQLPQILPSTVAWLHANVRGDGGGKPRILVNIVDGCDAFMENLDAIAPILSLLATLDIEGISIEDDRGTYMPFQVGAVVAAARSLVPAPKKILVHMHSGGGFENGSLVEALLNGADGAWGGLPKRAAIIGHASLGELIANLVRAGNPSMAARYDVAHLLPLATSLQELDSQSPVPDDEPILGRNAYRLTMDFFRQTTTRAMDLPPEAIGGTYGYRVCPLAADVIVLAGRLSEVTGNPPSTYDRNVLEMMIRLMRRDLRAGIKTDYDVPATLLTLYQRARAAST